MELGVVDVRDDELGIKQRLCDTQCGEAHAAGADDDQGTAGRVFLDLVERAVRREPRTRIRAGQLRGHIPVVEEVARMGHHHVIAEATIDVGTQCLWSRTQMLVAGIAHRAVTTADPRENDALGSDRDTL